jgi:hypothetical protein
LDEEGLQNAKIGLKDLSLSIYPTLIFLPTIKKFIIINNLENKTTIYENIEN